MVKQEAKIAHGPKKCIVCGAKVLMAEHTGNGGYVLLDPSLEVYRVQSIDYDNKFWAQPSKDVPTSVGSTWMAEHVCSVRKAGKATDKK